LALSDRHDCQLTPRFPLAPEQYLWRAVRDASRSLTHRERAPISLWAKQKSPYSKSPFIEQYRRSLGYPGGSGGAAGVHCLTIEEAMADVACEPQNDWHAQFSKLKYMQEAAALWLDHGDLDGANAGKSY